MKKFITLVFAAVFGISMCMAVSFENRVSPLKAVTNAEVNDTVQFYSVQEEDDGIFSFIWMGDSTKSKAYFIDIALLDTATYDYQIFSELGAYTTAFDFGYLGYFACSTDLVLEYGNNYSDIGSLGATADVIAAWQSAWEASVNDDNTLKPGFYVIFIEGVDASFNTTEAENHVIIEVVDNTLDAFESVFVNKNNNVIKYFNGKNIIIYTGTEQFDISGRKLK